MPKRDTRTWVRPKRRILSVELLWSNGIDPYGPLKDMIQHEEDRLMAEVTRELTARELVRQAGGIPDADEYFMQVRRQEALDRLKRALVEMQTAEILGMAAQLLEE